MIDLAVTQRTIFKWVCRNFPSTDAKSDAKSQLLNIGEEVGELMRCELKGSQGIRGDDWDEQAKKEFGDVILSLLCYASLKGFDAEEVITARMKEVTVRDWLANKLTGGA